MAYPLDDLWVAAELFKLGIRWREIAERLGYEQPSLYEATRRALPELRGRQTKRPDSRVSDSALVCVKARLATIDQEIMAAGESHGRVNRLKTILEAWLTEAESRPPSPLAQFTPRSAFWAIIVRLYGLGLQPEAIARLTGCNPKTMRIDIVKSGLWLPGKSRADVYCAVFLEYALLRFHQGPVSELIQDTKGYLELLRRFLRVPEILGYLLGVEETLRAFERFDRTPEQEPYTRLWEALYSSEQPYYSYERPERAVEAAWEGFLGAVEVNEIPSPASAREAGRFVATRMRAGRRGNTLPVWRDEWSQLIDTMLLRLTGRQRFMVRQRYGFDGAPVPLRRLGALSGLSVERSRQIIKEALIHLRLTDEFRLLAAQAVSFSVLQETAGKIFAELAEAKERICQMRAEPLLLPSGEIFPQIEDLLKRVDDLDLSVRAGNCLQSAGIEFVWQLVTKTEVELLKTRNLGRKSLNELKEILGEFGLSLGRRGLPPGDFPWNRE